MATPSPQHLAIVEIMLRRGEKVSAIKYYRQHANCGLTEAKMAVEAMLTGSKPPAAPSPPPSTHIPPGAGAVSRTGKKPRRKKKPATSGLRILLILLLGVFLIHLFSRADHPGFGRLLGDISGNPGKTPEASSTPSETRQRQQRAERQRAERQRAERERVERQRAERQRRARERAEKARAEHLQAQRQRLEEAGKKVVPPLDPGATLNGVPRPAATCAQSSAVAFKAGEDDHKSLKAAYAAKLANEAYVAWKSKPGLPLGHQNFIEEHQIKRIRARLAFNRRLPRNTAAAFIPTVTGDLPTIDGRLMAEEWRGATVFSIGGKKARTRLLLLADCQSLYLAADVPEDTTPEGFDQMRFAFHIDLSPWVVNERIHVGRGKGRRAVGGIRQTKMRWTGPAPTTKAERWKNRPISDWRIFKKAAGATSLFHHRQFEAILDLREAGLHIGVPFPARAVIETDPLRREEGRFIGRRYLGKLGNRRNPVWLVVGE